MILLDALSKRIRGFAVQIEGCLLRLGQCCATSGRQENSCQEIAAPKS